MEQKKLNTLSRLSLCWVFLLSFTLHFSATAQYIVNDAAVPLETTSTKSDARLPKDVIPGQYIVVYKDAALAKSHNLAGKPYAERQQMMKNEVASTLKRNKIQAKQVLHVYDTAIKGFAVAGLTEKEIERLRRDAQVAYIEQDQIFSIFTECTPKNATYEALAQSTPYGITRVGGGLSGAGKRAWIIDSGIDQDHPDLNVNTALSTYFIETSPEDGNGHGTHVAGTVAAIDNGIGVIGVAAGAEVVAVKVLASSNSGPYSGIIAGVNYVAANAASGDAANMSLGGGFSAALNAAVIAASAVCPFALAAGNESTNAGTRSPASANGPNIYTISAMDINDDWASFSNYGNPPVDYCEPGVNVESCWKNGGYNTISGTSMASPHMCGLLLLGNFCSNSTVNGDPDGTPDPIAQNSCCQPPTAVCQAYTAVLGPGGTVTVTPANVDGGSTYDCGLQSMTVSPNQFDCSHAGTQQTVTLTVTDFKGGSALCEATVTVRDITKPQIVDIPDYTLSGCNPAFPNTLTTTWIDNCATGGVITATAGPIQPGCTQTRVYTFTVADGNGNTDVETTTVTRTWDVTKPLFTFVPINVTVQCNNIPAVGTPTATDICSTPTIAYSGETRTDGACADTYTLTRKWTATDACGNTKTATQKITVVDTTKPAFTSVPGPVSLQCSDPIPPVGTPTATDNCDVSVDFTYLGEVCVYGNCPANRTLTRTWKATDNCGNFTTAAQVITHHSSLITHKTTFF